MWLLKWYSNWIKIPSICIFVFVFLQVNSTVSGNPAMKAPSEARKETRKGNLFLKMLAVWLTNLKSKGGCREIYTDVMNSVFLIHATPFGEGLPV